MPELYDTIEQAANAPDEPMTEEDTRPICDGCGDRFDDDEGRTMGNGDYICDSCYEDNGYSCSHCGDYDYIDNSYRDDSDDHICERCYNNHYFTCDSCGEIYHNDSYGSDGYCDNCCSSDNDNDYEESIDYDIHNRDYSLVGQRELSGLPADKQLALLRKERRQLPLSSTMPDYLFQTGQDHSMIQAKRHMAVEIEAEGSVSYSQLTHDIEEAGGRGFSVGSDGSLNNGVEVGTPPSSGSELVRNIRLVTSIMQDHDLHIERTCGLHTHVDLRDKRNDFTYLAHLATTMYAIEDILYAMQPQSRLNNSYCRPLRGQYSFYDFYGSQYINDFDFRYYQVEKSPRKEGEVRQLLEIRNRKFDHYGGSSIRYNGINIHSIFYRGTLEVRLHAGSLNATKILNWCNLLQAIVEWVDKDFSYRKVERLLQMDASHDKARLMGKIFKLDTDITDYIIERMTTHGHTTLTMNYSKGIKSTDQAKMRRRFNEQMRVMNQEFGEIITDSQLMARLFVGSAPTLTGDEERSRDFIRRAYHLSEGGI